MSLLLTKIQVNETKVEIHESPHPRQVWDRCLIRAHLRLISLVEATDAVGWCVCVVS